MKKIIQHLAIAFSTFFYTGFFPVAPGTVGSLLALLVMLIFGINFPEISGYFNAVFALASFLLGSLATQMAIDWHFKKPDPAQIVIDEVVGMSVTLSFIGFSPTVGGVVTYGLAFLMFRVFDVWKPSIIGRIDRSQASLAVMLDDVAAGVFAWCFVMPFHILVSILF